MKTNQQPEGSGRRGLVAGAIRFAAAAVLATFCCSPAWALQLSWDGDPQTIPNWSSSADTYTMSTAYADWWLGTGNQMSGGSAFTTSSTQLYSEPTYPHFTYTNGTTPPSYTDEQGTYCYEYCSSTRPSNSLNVSVPPGRGQVIVWGGSGDSTGSVCTATLGSSTISYTVANLAYPRRQYLINYNNDTAAPSTMTVSLAPYSVPTANTGFFAAALSLTPSNAIQLDLSLSSNPQTIPATVPGPTFTMSPTYSDWYLGSGNRMLGGTAISTTSNVTYHEGSYPRFAYSNGTTPVSATADGGYYRWNGGDPDQNASLTIHVPQGNGKVVLWAGTGSSAGGTLTADFPATPEIDFSHSLVNRQQFVLEYTSAVEQDMTIHLDRGPNSNAGFFAAAVGPTYSVQPSISLDTAVSPNPKDLPATVPGPTSVIPSSAADWYLGSGNRMRYGTAITTSSAATATGPDYPCFTYTNGTGPVSATSEQGTYRWNGGDPDQNASLTIHVPKGSGKVTLWGGTGDAAGTLTADFSATPGYALTQSLAGRKQIVLDYYSPMPQNLTLSLDKGPNGNAGFFAVSVEQPFVRLDPSVSSNPKVVEATTPGPTYTIPATAADWYLGSGNRMRYGSTIASSTSSTYSDGTYPRFTYANGTNPASATSEQGSYCWNGAGDQNATLTIRVPKGQGKVTLWGGTGDGAGTLTADFSATPGAGFIQSLAGRQQYFIEYDSPEPQNLVLTLNKGPNSNAGVFAVSVEQPFIRLDPSVAANPAEIPQNGPNYTISNTYRDWFLGNGNRKAGGTAIETSSTVIYHDDTYPNFTYSDGTDPVSATAAPGYYCWNGGGGIGTGDGNAALTIHVQAGTGKVLLWGGSGPNGDATLTADFSVTSGAGFTLPVLNRQLDSLDYYSPVAQDILLTLDHGSNANAGFFAVALVPSTLVWTGGASGDNNWTTGANWGGAYAAAGACLQFGVLDPVAHAENFNDFAAGTEFVNITFTNGAPSYVLQGNAIRLIGGVMNQSDWDQEIRVDMELGAAAGTFDDGGRKLTVSGALSGAGPLAKIGAGTLVLTGSNTYTGRTTVTAGTLEFKTIADEDSGPSALGNPGVGNGQIDLGTDSTSATLRFTGENAQTSNRVVNLLGTGTIDASGGQRLTLRAATDGSPDPAAPIITSIDKDLTLTGSGAGAVESAIRLGAGRLTKDGGGIWTLSGSNWYDGGTIVLAGTLEVAAVNALPAGTSLTIGGDGVVVLASGLSAPAGGAAVTQPVPEPGTLALLAAGALSCLALWLRRKE